MEETSISSNAVISSSAGRRERLGEVDCFELSSSSVLKLQKRDITTWFVDGRTDAIRDTTGLTAENAELRLRLQTMEQEAQLRDVLNEALKHEVERLKIATGETSSTGEANEVGLSPLPFNPSFFPIPQPHTNFPLQSIQLPPPSFHQPQLTTTNHPLLSYSHPLSDNIPHDHLGRLQHLDISKGPMIVKSESSTISASESSSTF